VTSVQFCFWLQGFFELQHKAGGAPMDLTIGAAQTRCIEQHLALVFKHEIDPSQGTPEHQAELNAIHSPPAPPVTAESLKAAIEEAVNKLPKKPGGGFGGEGPGGVVYRC
jgi:hypothetical protein